MFYKKFTFVLFLAAAFLFLNAAPSFAQEVGGNLGSSAGVFRPKTPVKSSPETKKTARKPTPALKPKTNSAVSSKKKPAPVKSVKIEKSRKTDQNQADNAAGTSASTGKTPRVSVDESFETAIEEGNAARDERNFAEAQQAYERALKIKPKDFRASYGLATIHADQQRWDEAEKYYRRAVALDPTNIESLIALSEVLVQPNRGGNVLSRFEDAETMARRAVALDKKNAFAYDQLGVALEARGIIQDETEHSYRKAIELNPNHPVAYAHLARLLRKRGRNKDANAAYKKAIELANDVTNLMLVAEVLQSEQRFEESENLLRRVLTVDAANPTALFLLGRALLVKQSNAEAEKFLLRSVAVSPRTLSTYVSLVSLYLRTLRFEDAENTILKILPMAAEADRKQFAGTLSLTGDGYLKQKKVTQAIRAYKKARELDSNNPQLQAKLTAAQQAVGKK